MSDFLPEKDLSGDDQGHCDSFPASFAQQRLWMLDQLAPGNPAYNIRFGTCLKGNLDVSILRKALGEIIRRHESLRTHFANIEGVRQIIAPSECATLELTDLGNARLDEREHLVQQLASAEAQQPFDLSRGPLLRAKLLRLAEQEHVLLLTMHHIISDGWSMGLLFKELSTLYNAYAKGEESPLEELAVQYADYAVWQREAGRAELLAEQLAYWKEKLAGAPQVLSLPTDYPRPPVQTYRGRRLPVRIPADVTKRLRELSAGEGATMFMTLLAAFQVLLWRLSGERDISVGTPVAGRTRAQLEKVIGFFVNTIVLRTRVQAAHTFIQLLHEVRKVCVSAYAHQELPFEMLLANLHTDRSLSHQPLFQVMFQVQNSPAETLSFDGIESTPILIENETAKFDLMFSLSPIGEELIGFVEYSTDLFEAETIERMVSSFREIVRSISEDAEQRVSRLPLLSQEQRHQLLFQWNKTDTQSADEGQERYVQEEIERQARERPESVAVSCGEEAISYQELNERANQLSHYLREQGVGPEVVVGVCLRRSIEMMVSLLGVMKAGGCYLPLDPEYPSARLQYMVKEARVSLLLTESGLMEGWEGEQVRRISMDRDAVEWAEHSEENPGRIVSGENLAYLIYTSGSTGRPKGVMIEHRNLNHLLWAIEQRLHPEPGEVMLAVTTLSFDIAGLELYLPLMSGGQVAIYAGLAGDGMELRRSLESSRASVMQATPTTWREVLAAGGGEQLRELRVLSGGEALSEQLAEQLRESSLEVWNLYGPTETTIWSLGGVIDERGVRLGERLGKTQVYVLDEEQEPVPVGVSGELYIGGAGVGRGYWGAAELTAERFVPHAWSEEAGARLYRTGDICRYRRDGELEYVGRADDEVKVRGQRIELGEIEAALNEVEGVEQSVVVARRVAEGEAELVGYVVSGSRREVRVGELRRELREKLPEYMVPSQFVRMEKLPLTANGKIDRRALPEPEAEATAAPAYVEARTPVEEIVVGIWQEVLGLKRVGVYDNFFELGGHSLLATRIISRVRKSLAVDLPLRTIFESPTIAELSENIANNPSTTDYSIRRASPILG
jgi:amino acid adenylation domain-containing protein